MIPQPVAPYTLKRPRMMVGPKRPVDKVVYYCQISANTTATINTVFTANEALTYSGGTITGNLVGNIAPGTMTYSLQYVQDGNSPADITPATNTEFNPEQNILWVGAFYNPSSTAGLVHQPIIAKLKAMRKMKKGDTIVLVTDSDNNNSSVLTVTLTLFFKQ